MEFCECKSIKKDGFCTNQKCINYKEIKEVKEKVEKGFKKCPRCSQVLPALDNYFHRGGTGYFDYCHECNFNCRKEYKRLGRDTTRDKVK